MKVVKEYNLEMMRPTFNTDCHLEVWVRRAHAEEVTRKFRQAGANVEELT